MNVEISQMVSEKKKTLARNVLEITKSNYIGL